jgi:hypothetical protein
VSAPSGSPPIVRRGLYELGGDDREMLHPVRGHLAISLDDLRRRLGIHPGSSRRVELRGSARAGEPVRVLV